MSGQRIDAARNRKRVLEAAVDEHRGGPARNLLAPPIDREQWDGFAHSTRAEIEV